MEPNKDLYQSAVSRLKASPELKEKILDATEQKRKPKKFVWRRAVVVAAVAALLFALAMGANAATGGELLFQFSLGKLERVVPMDSGRYAYFYRNGEKLSVLVKSENPRITTMEPQLVVVPGKEETRHIVTFEGDSSGNGGKAINQVVLKIVSDADGTPVNYDTTTITWYNTSATTASASKENDRQVNRIVYSSVIKLVPTQEANTTKFAIGDVQVKIIDSKENGAVSVEVQNESGEESAGDEKQPEMEAESD